MPAFGGRSRSIGAIWVCKSKWNFVLDLNGVWVAHHSNFFFISRAFTFSWSFYSACMDFSFMLGWHGYPARLEDDGKALLVQVTLGRQGF